MLWAFRHYPIATWSITGVSAWVLKNFIVIQHQRSYFRADDEARRNEMQLGQLTQA